MSKDFEEDRPDEDDELTDPRLRVIDAMHTLGSMPNAVALIVSDLRLDYKGAHKAAQQISKQRGEHILQQQATISNLQLQVVERDKSIAELKQLVDIIRNRRVDECEATDGTLLRAQLDGAIGERDSISQRHNDALADLDRRLAEVAKLKREKVTLENQVNGLRGLLDEANTNTKALIESNQRLSEERTALQTQIGELQRQVKVVIEERNGANAVADGWLKEFQGAQDDLARLNKECREIEVARDQLAEQLKGMVEVKNNYYNQMVKAQSERDEWKQKASVFEGMYDEAAAERDQWKHKADEFYLKWSQANQRYAELQDRVREGLQETMRKIG